MTTFHTSEQKAHENIVGKGENARNQHFLLFPIVFSTLSKRNCIIESKLNYHLQVLSIWTKVKYLLFDKGLTHSHTMTPFDASGKEAFWKHFGKRRNCLYKQFLLFPQYFLLYQRQKLSFLLHLICRLQIVSIWTSLKFCHLVMG